MSTVTTLQGKSTFGFEYAKRRAIQYLQKTNQEHQILQLPKAYPLHSLQMSEIDIVVRAKMLKAHLEDVIGANRCQVKTVRRKNPVIIIQHDSLDREKITEIAEMYVDVTCLVLKGANG